MALFGFGGGTSNGSGNSSVTVNSSPIGSGLLEILLCEGIEPGAVPSYEMCKLIYEYHPLGKKMADAPVAMAQSQDRTINIQKGPEEAIRDAFLEEWKQINADRYIANTRRLSRVYGLSAIAVKVKGQKDADSLQFEKLAGNDISFSVFDPLNVSGSVVLNQQPNDFDFLKSTGIAVQGQIYHPSRTVIMMNEDPIYLGWTTSSFGYVGRSCYQRALFPLKSFLQSMITDDMVTRKAGLLVAMMKQPGSMVDNVMLNMAAIKRNMLKIGGTNNVLTVGHEDKIETLNMQNLDGAYGLARKNILENMAAADDMPAVLLNSETFAEGFGEGTEDAKKLAKYVARERATMAPLYDFFDKIVMYRAWNEDFYKTIQKRYPEDYGKMPYEQAFLQWQNNFKADWPNLLEEPDSEKIKVDEIKHKTILGALEVLLPVVDPENKARVIQWAADNMNEQELLFSSPLELDYEAIAAYEPPEQQALQEPEEPKIKADSESRADADFNESDHPRDEGGKFSTSAGSGAKAIFGTNKKTNVQEALNSIKGAGFNSELWHKPGTPSAAIYSNGKIYVNSAHKFWANPVENMKQQAGHLSSEDPNHLLNHEIGHAIYDPPDNFMTLSHQDLARKVSKYAARNPKEFVSEVHAAVVSGREFPAEVMSVFERYARRRGGIPVE